MSLKKRGDQANLGKSLEPELIFQTHNSWNPRLLFNEET